MGPWKSSFHLTKAIVFFCMLKGLMVFGAKSAQTWCCCLGSLDVLLQGQRAEVESMITDMGISQAAVEQLSIYCISLKKWVQNFNSVFLSRFWIAAVGDNVPLLLLFCLSSREYDSLKGSLKSSNDMSEKLKREVVTSNNKVAASSLSCRAQMKHFQSVEPLTLIFFFFTWF